MTDLDKIRKSELYQEIMGTAGQFPAVTPENVRLNMGVRIERNAHRGQVDQAQFCVGRTGYVSFVSEHLPDKVVVTFAATAKLEPLRAWYPISHLVQYAP